MAEKVRLDADFYYSARDLIGSRTEINSLVYSVRNSYGKGFEPNQECRAPGRTDAHLTIISIS